jgi:hypothetical protein
LKPGPAGWFKSAKSRPGGAEGRETGPGLLLLQTSKGKKKMTKFNPDCIWCRGLGEYETAAGAVTRCSDCNPDPEIKAILEAIQARDAFRLAALLGPRPPKKAN